MTTRLASGCFLALSLGLSHGAASDPAKLEAGKSDGGAGAWLPEGSWDLYMMRQAKQQGIVRFTDLPKKVAIKISRDKFTVYNDGILYSNYTHKIDHTKSRKFSVYEDGKLKYKGLFSLRDDHLELTIDELTPSEYPDSAEVKAEDVEKGRCVLYYSKSKK